MLDKIDRYTIEREIGRGGMAVVYLAYDPKLKRQVCIKLLRTVGKADKEFLELFRNEVELVATLEHPAIVRVYDFGEYDGYPYLVMQYMEGGTLAEQLAHGPISLTKTLEIILQLMPAFEEIHGRRIVHRDIKPSNILFDRHGNPFLADFGVAKVIETTYGTNSRSIGTLAYMGPERFDVGDKIDIRTDIYAVGVTIFEMLTGQLPYKSDSAGQLIRMHLMDPIPSAVAIRSDLPFKIDRFFEKAMAKSMIERYTSIRYLVDALKAIEARYLQYENADIHDTPEQPDYEAVKVEAPTVLADQKKYLPSRFLGGCLLIGFLLLAGSVAFFMAINPLASTPIPVPQPTSTQTSPPAPTFTLEPTLPLTGLPTHFLSATPNLILPVSENTPVPASLQVISDQNIDALTQVAQWGKGAINEMVRSPDQNILGIATYLGVSLYDARSLERLQVIQIDQGSHTLAFTPDSQMVVTGSRDGVIRLWQLDGTLVNEFQGHTNIIDSLIFSPDGEFLASGSEDGTVHLWDAENFTAFQTLDGYSGRVTIAFSPDSQLLASSSENGQISLWDVSENAQKLVWQGHNVLVFDLAFSPTDPVLASSSFDDTVKLWNIENGTLLRTLTGHSFRVTRIDYSPDGNFLASASWDKTIRVWQVSNGITAYVLEGHSSLVLDVLFSSIGDETLISSSQDGSIRRWNTANQKILVLKQDFDGLMRCVATSPNGQFVAIGTRAGLIQLWDAKSSRLIQTMAGHTDQVTSLAFTHDSQTLISGSDDKTIRIWQISDGKPLNTLTQTNSNIESIAVALDGSTLIAGDFMGRIWEWNLSSGELLKTMAAHNNSIWNIALSPDGTFLASASLDGTVKIWQTADDTLFQTIPIGDQAYSVAFSPDNELLAIGFGMGMIEIWNIRQGERITSFQGHNDQIWALTFNPDGNILASGSLDSSVHLWSVLDWNLVQTLQQHVDSISQLAFSNDGTWLMSTSWDGTVRMWGILP